MGEGKVPDFGVRTLWMVPEYVASKYFYVFVCKTKIDFAIKRFLR